MLHHKVWSIVSNVSERPIYQSTRNLDAEDCNLINIHKVHTYLMFQ